MAGRDNAYIEHSVGVRREQAGRRWVRVRATSEHRQTACAGGKGGKGGGELGCVGRAGWSSGYITP